MPASGEVVMRVGYTYVCTFALVAAAVAAPFTLPRLLESHGSAGPARTTAAPPRAPDTVVRMAALPAPSAVVNTQHVPVRVSPPRTDGHALLASAVVRTAVAAAPVRTTPATSRRRTAPVAARARTTPRAARTAALLIAAQAAALRSTIRRHRAPPVESQPPPPPAPALVPAPAIPVAVVAPVSLQAANLNSAAVTAAPVPVPARTLAQVAAPAAPQVVAAAADGRGDHPRDQRDHDGRSSGHDH
jgi:hypothetical protein